MKDSSKTRKLLFLITFLAAIILVVNSAFFIVNRLNNGNYHFIDRSNENFSTLDKNTDIKLMTAQTSKPIFAESTVPTAVFAGQKFTFAEWKAYDYANLDEQSQPAEIPVTIKIDGSALSGNEWTPTLAEGVKEQAFTVQFSASNVNGESVKEFTVYAVSPSRDSRLLVNYFYFEGIEVVDNDVTMPLVATSNSAKAYFIAPISDKVLDINIVPDNEKSNYTAVRVNIVDTVNPAQKVVLDITKQDSGDESIVALNGVDAGKIAGSFSSKSTPFVIKYNYETGAFHDYNNNVFCYAETAEGNKIVGFDSGLVYVSFELVGASTSDSGSSLFINSIGGQIFSSSIYDGDYTEPSLSVKNNRTFAYGKEAVIKPAFAYDILSSLAEFKLTVKSPSGVVILDGVDPTVENKFTVSEYGVYKVSYFVKDTNGNSRTITNNVHCLKYVKPVLEYEGAIPSRVEVGDEISLPKITVSGTDEEVTLSVVLIAPNGQRTVIDGDSVILDKLGTNQIIVMAYDAYGNTAIDTFSVTVIE